MRTNGIKKEAEDEYALRDYVIKLDSIEKKIRGNTIIKDLNLQMKRAEIYGLLGANGSGKTSVIRLILNLWKPTCGTIEVLGEKITASSFLYRQKIGVVLENSCFQKQLTGKQNLELYCSYMKNTKLYNIDRMLKLLEMKDAADLLLKEYSEGMKRRLDIVRAIVTKPEIILMDEPFRHLDIKNREYLGLLLKLFRERLGTSVFITASSADEMNDLADRIGFIEKGTLRRELEASEYSQWLREQKKVVW